MPFLLFVAAAAAVVGLFAMRHTYTQLGLRLKYRNERSFIPPFPVGAVTEEHQLFL